MNSTAHRSYFLLRRSALRCHVRPSAMATGKPKWQTYYIDAANKQNFARPSTSRVESPGTVDHRSVADKALSSQTYSILTPSTIGLCPLPSMAVHTTHKPSAGRRRSRRVSAKKISSSTSDTFVTALLAFACRQRC